MHAFPKRKGAKRSGKTILGRFGGKGGGYGLCIEKTVGKFRVVPKRIVNEEMGRRGGGGRERGIVQEVKKLRRDLCLRVRGKDLVKPRTNNKMNEWVTTKKIIPCLV